MVKKKNLKQKLPQFDAEVQNAFRLIKRATSLSGDQITGDLHNLPITITYAISDPVELPNQLDTHFDVVQYALHFLVSMGFTVEAALNIVFSAKATNDVIRNMHAKT
jgi:hypothetical protein